MRERCPPGRAALYLPPTALTALTTLTGFFGFGDSSGGDKGKELAAAEARRTAEAGGAPEAEAEAEASQAADMLSQDMPGWLEEEQGAGKMGPEALFARLDLDESGEVRCHVT